MRKTVLALGLALVVGCGGTQSGTTTVAPPTTATAAAPKPVATHPLPAFPSGWPFPAGAAQTSSLHGMVVTDAELATKVGQDILASGGNAADAAIATAFALAVVYPTAGNVGGGGFLVARIDGAPYALDFRETAPAGASRDMYLGADGKPNGASRSGHRASGVPGSVAGLWEAYQKIASKKKTWAELLAPAIKLADEGFVVSAGFAESVAQSERLKKFPASAALFYPGGTPVAAGAKWKNAELAAVLKRVADLGAKGFYEGPTADAIVAEMKRGDGLITADDLKAYKAKWRTPLEITYKDHRLITMPPPSSGGVTVGMICHILETYDLKALGWHSPAELHVVFEAMRRAFVSRNAKLGDPDFVTNPVETLLSDAWAKQQRDTILKDKATPSSELSPNAAPASGSGPHTTHFSVVDGQGNAVALTTTINWWYGSGVTVAGAGFLLNNEMDDFATVPGTANGFGLVQGEPNAIAGGKRMLSSMSPTIVTSKDGKVELVLGAAGGPTIITTVFQLLSNVVDFGFDMTTAEAAPRFHVQDFPDVVMGEPHGLPDETKAALTSMGYAFKEREHIADAPSIARDGERWIGAPEPRRKSGLAAGF